MKFKQVWDGKPMAYKLEKPFYFSCCDCAAVDRAVVLSGPKPGYVTMVFWHDAIETAKERRRLKRRRRTT